MCPLPHYCARLPPTSPPPPGAPTLSRSPLPPAPLWPPAPGSLLRPTTSGILSTSSAQVPCGAERALPLAGRRPRRPPDSRAPRTVCPQGLEDFGCEVVSRIRQPCRVCVKPFPRQEGTQPARALPARGIGGGCEWLEETFQQSALPEQTAHLSRTLSGRSCKELLLFQCGRRRKEAKVCASDS